MDLHLTPVWPRPQFVMSQCLTNACFYLWPHLPQLHPRPLWLRPDETGWNCVWNVIKVLKNSVLQPDKCPTSSRCSVPAQMSARDGPDVGVKSLFASPTSLSSLQNHSIYNQMKREISYLFVQFYTFLSFFHFTHSSQLSTTDTAKEKTKRNGEIKTWLVHSVDSSSPAERPWVVTR